MSSLILGIDTATTSVSVALSTGVASDLGGIIAVNTLSFGMRDAVSARGVGGPRHAETLLPAIEFLCRQCGVALADLTHMVVDRGPGLFTGLRVGVATARTLAFANDIPLFSSTSLEAVAVEGGRPGELVASVLDARRSEVYVGLFRMDLDGGLSTIVEPIAGKPDLVVEVLLEAIADLPVRVVGDGVLTHPDALQRLLALPLASIGGPLAPTAVGLIEAVLPRLHLGPIGEEAEIAYLRAPDAEITWDNRHGPAATS